MKLTIENSEKIKKILDEKPEYRACLFSRGYFITEDHVDDTKYPFYSLWKKVIINGYSVLIHKDQDFYIFEGIGKTFLLIGHAYNPFNGIYEEQILLSQAADKYDSSKMEFLDEISGWTGIFCVFVFDKEITAVQDCAGFKALYYGIIKDKMCFMSHPQMAADIYNLDMDPFVKRLVKNRFYNIGNRYLPGDLSPFTEIKRIGANVYLCCDEKHTVSIHRFYPVRPLDHCETEADYWRKIEESYRLLNKNIELASKKWPNIAISLSGGTDSQTTLACANGMYEKFHFFSFYSKESELRDSQAASEICKRIGVKHHIYPIPMENDAIEDYEELKSIIVHSYGYIRGLAEHEVRKHICMYRWDYFDTEIKSMSSEIVRVFFPRKYGTEFPRKLTPRYFSILQTRYFASPLLLYKSDRIYKKYMEKFDLVEPKCNFEHTDLYFWEVRLSNWGMLMTQSLDICHRVTFPFNNRKLIELMLSLPREARKSDNVHKDIMRIANPEIVNANIHVENGYHSAKRILLEYIFLKYRTIFEKCK